MDSESRIINEQLVHTAKSYISETLKKAGDSHNFVHGVDKESLVCIYDKINSENVRELYDQARKLVGTQITKAESEFDASQIKVGAGVAIVGIVVLGIGYV